MITLHGLQADLAECLTRLESAARVGEFVLGQNDFSDRFQAPQKLYGREKEAAILMDAFEKVGAGGVALMLVSGYAGIGKTSLVNEIHKPIVKRRGYFIAGKFDQFKRDIPYNAVIQAFHDLIRQILTQEEEHVKEWRDGFLNAFGANGQIVINVIPEVELITGRQPAVPELPPTEAQNRFNHVFKDFASSLCGEKNPLAFFLDDLQWADTGGLKRKRISSRFSKRSRQCPLSLSFIFILRFAVLRSGAKPIGMNAKSI